MKSRRTVLTALAVLLLGVLIWIYLAQRGQPATPIPQKQPSTAAPKVRQPSLTPPSVSSASDAALSDPTNPSVIVNKHRPLSPKTYVPSDLVVPNVAMRANITGDERQLRSVAAAALETMFAAAAKEGISLTLQSGYRSYELQTSVYNRYVSRQGKAVADSQSARPGYSEHQTGLGADIGTATGNCNVETCFAETKEGIWLASNAPSFGFVIRYPEGKTAVTGYIYEPWHIRYVGSELAQKQKASQSTTLEEYLGLEAAPDYN